MPDLSGANLSRLTNTKLAGANLSGARLVETDFDYSYLKNCNLQGADLCRAFGDVPPAVEIQRRLG